MDAFGQPIQLYFDGINLHKTRTGGLITLIIFVIILIVLVTSLSQLTNKIPVSVDSKLEYAVTPPKLDLNKRDFIFAISPQDLNMNLNYSVFSYSASLVTQTKILGTNDFNTVTSDILLTPCAESDFENLESEFRLYKLDQAMCPSLDQYDVEGAYGDQLFSYLKISVIQCVNGTNDAVTCAPQSFIDAYFSANKKVRVGLYFINRVFNPFGFDNPFSKFLDNQVWVLSSLGKLVRMTDIFLRQTIVNSRSNALGIGLGTNVAKPIYLNERVDDSYVPNPNDNTYLTVYFRSSNNIETNYRSYQTLAGVLSFVGGIWNLLYLVLGCVAAYINRLLFQATIANALYDYNSNHLKESSEDKKKKVDEQLEDFSDMIDTKTPEETHSILQKIRNIYSNMKNMRADLDFKFKDIFMRLCPCFSYSDTKHKLLLKATEKLAHDIDIRLILRRIQEVDKLKKIILDEDQKAIFQFVPPEIIDLDDNSTEKKEENNKEIPLTPYTVLEVRSETDSPITSSKSLKKDNKNINKMLSVKEENKQNKPEEEEEEDMFEDACQKLTNYRDYRSQYRKIKESGSKKSEKILNSLHKEIREIFDVVDEHYDDLFENEQEKNKMNEVEMHLFNREHINIPNIGLNEIKLEEKEDDHVAGHFDDKSDDNVNKSQNSKNYGKKVVIKLGNPKSNNSVLN